MSRFMLLAAALLSLSACQTQSPPRPETNMNTARVRAVEDLRREMPFTEARQILTAGGWESRKPAVCSNVSGLDNCAYEFRTQQGDILKVTTSGEGASSKVTGWGSSMNIRG